MNSGKLDTKIKFQKWQGTIPDGTGGYKDSELVPVLDTWCSFIQIRSSVVLQAMQLTAKRAYRTMIYKREGFDPAIDMVCLVRGHNYNINSLISDDETFHELILVRT